MTMRGKNRNRWRGKLASCMVVLTLLLIFCTGCFGESGSGGSETTPTPTPTPASPWTDVQPGTEIDTLNVVLVIDTSASTLEKDPDRNWLESACMFLDALYASASGDGANRLSGSKKANVGVVLYNDTIVDKYTVAELASEKDVDHLRGIISPAAKNIPNGSGDGALFEALATAVDFLSQDHPRRQEGLYERSAILLFTDGYTGYVPSSASAPPLSTGQDFTQSDYESVEGMPPTDAVSGATGDASAGVATGGDNLPDFGDNRQAQWKDVLDRAKNNDYEIFVLMLNPDNGANEGWEEFKKIADYTKRNFWEKAGPALDRLKADQRFEDLPLKGDAYTWPESADYTRLDPAFLSDPMYGGGVFPNPDGGDDVTYLTARSSPQMLSFYATMAANMLSGSSVEDNYRSRIEAVHYQNESERDTHVYNIKVPDGGVSALICYFFSEDGISDIYLKKPGSEQIEYQLTYDNAMGKPSAEGWIYDGAMRMGWYPHIDTEGWQCNIAALTIVDPEPGIWNVYLRGKNGIDTPPRIYTSLVNGSKVDIKFRQGDTETNPDIPVTTGEFAVQIRSHDVAGQDGDPMSAEFYKSLKTECSATRIPPWAPIYGEDDIKALMNNPISWVTQVLGKYQKPEKWLDQMSGHNIQFQPDSIRFQQDDGEDTPVLTGRFDIPIPGLYYVTLYMTLGEGNSQISYSRSFWADFEAKADHPTIQIPKANRDEIRSQSVLLPEKWRQTSNTSAAENLVLKIDESSIKIEDETIATARVDSSNGQQSLVVHSEKKGHTELSFDVTTEYGDRWKLTYDVIVN